MNAINTDQAEQLLAEFQAFLHREEERNGGVQPALRPPHRVHFEWRRKLITRKYHIPVAAWTGHATLEIDGQQANVDVAETEYGVFGRCERFWAEARGASVDAMLAALREECEPLWDRQRSIACCLGIEGRVEAPLETLSGLDLLKLFYCSDRDVANEAMEVLEEKASQGIWGPSLLAIMRDRSHPLRRQAQWCALDLLEDLYGFFPDDTLRTDAMETLERFMWDCEDDFARSCYKCGDVLGDHIANDHALDLLLKVLESAPSHFGRRSAIHGLIHITEWVPRSKDQVISALRRTSELDSQPLLREYALVAISDIGAGAPSLHPHGPEPSFPGE